MIALTQVPASSAVGAFGYEAATQTLKIVTPAGKAYHYRATPEQAQEFADAESKGRAWGSLIRPHCELIDAPEETPATA